ncbi:MAG: excinuclease ABC subunit A, partial [Planctomycetota bacterium]
GFVRARVDGELIELDHPPALDRYRRHDIEVVIDRLVIREGIRARLAEALDLALATGDGAAIVAPMADGAEPSKRRRAAGDARDILLSADFACTHCGLSFEPPHPQMFSFNSPQGMCAQCDGLGRRFDFDPDLLVPDDSKNILAPCIAALRTRPGRWRRHIYEGVARHVGFDLKTPWRDLPEKARRALLFGTGAAHITFEWRGRHGVWKHGGEFPGILAELRSKHRKATSPIVRRFYEQFMRETACDACRGARLNPQALAVTLRSSATGEELNIAQLCGLSIARARAFFEELDLGPTESRISVEPLKEIRSRLEFLLDVGLDYLTLDRAAPTLSG